MQRKPIMQAAVILTLAAGSAFQAIAQDAVTTATVTSATGTIAQLNYDADGTVSGFLIGANILLAFSTNVCGGIGTLGAVGNAVTYSGTSVTNSTTNFQVVRVTSLTNTTTKATYTAPSATTSPATAYGPASGTVKQLNYDTSGAIDGFLFAASGSTASIFVSTGSRAGSTLKPLLTVGATVSVTGRTSAGLSACAATSTLEAVDAASLAINGQTIVIAGAGGGGNFGPGHGGGR